MGFFDSLFSPPAPAVTSGRRAAALPKLEGAAIPTPGAGAPIREPGAPAAYLDSLLKERKPIEAVRFLAENLPEPDAVKWACESCNVVAAKLPAEDRHAMSAASRWIEQPNAAVQAEAGAAAAKAGHKGPGAWAAQAAAWSKPAVPSATHADSDAPRIEETFTPQDLVGKAVAGSVMLAAALTKRNFVLPAPATVAGTPGATPPPTPNGDAAPAAKAPEPTGRELYRLLKPFLDRGIEIASGR